jgi:copper chaperone
MEHVTLAISGMSCGGCVSKVSNALTTIPGVQVDAVTVGSATVSYDNARTTPRPASTDSSSPQHAEAGRMISATPTADARWSSAATPQQTSRSVTTPTTLRVFASSITGAQPQPELRMAVAASAAVSFGPQHPAAPIGFITSPQQLMVLSACNLSESSRKLRAFPTTFSSPHYASEARC